MELEAALFKNSTAANIPQSAPSINVCAIILTRGREDWCCRAIDSLIGASHRCPAVRLTIRIHLNGHDPSFAERLQDRVTNVPPQIRLEMTSGHPDLPGMARNRILEKSKADWVCFVDDDAFVPPSHFARFHEILHEFPEIDVIGGPNLTPPGSPRFAELTGHALSSRFATASAAARYRVRGDRRVCGESELILCNLFIRRDLLSAEAFPPALVCAEENGLLLELKAQGRQFLHAPDLVVWHERRPKAWDFAQQIFKYGCGRGQLIRRRPRTIQPIHIVALLGTIGFFGLSIVALLASWRAFVLPFGAYAILCLFSSFVSGTPAPFMTAALFPIIHLCYGLGIAWGFLWLR